ncbi:hypothetical protein OAQ99_04445, partial [Candidatus Kapabacteria bacterium]|nr:hypothetical protein [Candidatus Kapabacteria bacterium]
MYSSQSGAGMAGWGWNVNGISAISRISKSKFLDNEFSALTLGSDDLLSLDGNRLIKVDDSMIYGNQACIYTTLQGNEIRVEHSDGGTGIGYFIVKDKNGTKSYYGNGLDHNGNDNDSKVILKKKFSNDEVIMSWRLNKVEDINGNYIEYIYEQRDGQNLIKEIRYTGTENSSPAIEPYAKIVFEYKQKSNSQYDSGTLDQNIFYPDGLVSKNKYVMTDIIVFYKESGNYNEVKRYELEYFYDNVTYLLSISELGEIPVSPSDPINDRLRTNETVFEYYNEEPKVSYAELDDLPSYIDDINYTIHFGDFNGDGIKDRLIIDRQEEPNNEKAILYLQYGIYFECDVDPENELLCTNKMIFEDAESNDPLNYPNIGYVGEMIDYKFEGGLLYNQNIVVADINNDGLDDLLLPSLDHYDEWWSKYYQIYGPFQTYWDLDLTVYKGTVDNLKWVVKYEELENSRRKGLFGSFYTLNEKFLVADYTGDGTLELVYQAEYHSDADPRINQHQDQLLYYLDLIDDNGDFNFQNQTVPSSYLYKKTLRSWDGIKLRDLGTYNEIFADFYNCELISNGKSELLFAVRNDLNDYGEEGVYTIEFDLQDEPYLNLVYDKDDLGFDIGDEIILTDFNGDSFSDILYYEDDESLNPRSPDGWTIKYWVNSGFSAREDHLSVTLDNHASLGKDISFKNINFFDSKYFNLLIGDFNGDGKSDLLSHYSKGQTLLSPSSSPYITGKFNVNINLITNIGMGKYSSNFQNTTLLSEQDENYDDDRIATRKFHLVENSISRKIYSPWLFGTSEWASVPISYYMQTDVNGDGNADIFNKAEVVGYENDGLILINPGQHPRHLKTITDGLGNSTTLTYKPISSGNLDENDNIENAYVYEKDNSPTEEDLKPFNAGIWVVDAVEKRKSKKEENELRIEYRYGDAKFHKELGFLGFRKFFTKTFDMKGSSYFSETRQYFKVLKSDYQNDPRKIYTLVPEKTETYRNSTHLETQIFDKDYFIFKNAPYEDNNYIIYDKSIKIEDHYNKIRTETYYEYDETYDNSLEFEEVFVKRYDSPNQIVSRNKTIYGYTSRGSYWGTSATNLNNKLESITKESEIFNRDASGNLISPTPFTSNPLIQTKTEFYYKGSSDNYMLDYKIDNPNSITSLDNELRTTYQYDDFGNIIEEKVTGRDLNPDGTTYSDKDIYKKFNYENRGRFVIAETNNNFSLKLDDNNIYYNEYEYNEIYGAVETATDILENNSYSDYDGFGRKMSSVDNFGNKIFTHRYWYNDIAPDPFTIIPNDSEILYVIHNEVEDGFDSWEYYDGWGNLIRSETESYKEDGIIDKIVNTVSYHPDGRVDESSYPYFVGEETMFNVNPDPDKKVVIDYDSFLREWIVRDQNRLTVYVYNNSQYGLRSTRIIQPDGKYTVTINNEAGLTTKSITSNGTNNSEDQVVTYYYKNDGLSKKISTIYQDNLSESLDLYLDYDIYGNKVGLEDKDAGTFSYEYNAFGQLLKEEKLVSTGPNVYEEVKANIYDVYGRLDKKTWEEESGTDISYDYSYYTNPDPGVGQIKTVTKENHDDIISYSYDAEGRIHIKTEIIDNGANDQAFLYEYDYNTDGTLNWKKLPSGVTLKNHYHTDGSGEDYRYLEKIERIDDPNNPIVWELRQMNEFGKITQYLSATAGLVLNETIYDSYQMPTNIRASYDFSDPNNIDWNIQNWVLDFNEENGNLISREDLIPVDDQKEFFYYDDLDRLTNVKKANNQTDRFTISYKKDGSINTKSDLGSLGGTYKYLNQSNLEEFPYHGVKDIQTDRHMQGH